MQLVLALAVSLIVGSKVATWHKLSSQLHPAAGGVPLELLVLLAMAAARAPADAPWDFDGPMDGEGIEEAENSDSDLDLSPKEQAANNFIEVLTDLYFLLHYRQDSFVSFAIG